MVAVGNTGYNSMFQVWDVKTGKVLVRLDRPQRRCHSGAV